MAPRPPLVVLKFGGSVLADERSLDLAGQEIRRWRRDGYRVVAVVSALSGVTDGLGRACQRLNRQPSPLCVAAALAIGGLHSAALLGVRLDGAGIRASVLTPAAIRLTATGSPLDAMPVDADAAPLRAALRHEGVVVVPGYAAIDRRGRTTVLGRGGSDLTALFLAHRLQADRCRLVKDVDGLYDRDPASAGSPPQRYQQATWSDALRTDGSIVQHKAVRFARAHRIEFELGRVSSIWPTLIGPGPTRLASVPLPLALRAAAANGGPQAGVETTTAGDPRPAERQLASSCITVLRLL